MKTLKTIVMGLALVIAFTSAKADGQPSKKEVLDIFMNASTHGKMDKFESVLANDVEFSIQRGDNTVRAHKNEIVSFYKASENVDQACKCTSTTLKDTEDKMVVKIEMKYADYTRTNLVTIKNVSGNWKITKVETSVEAAA